MPPFILPPGLGMPPPAVAPAAGASGLPGSDAQLSAYDSSSRSAFQTVLDGRMDQGGKITQDTEIKNKTDKFPPEDTSPLPEESTALRAISGSHAPATHAAVGVDVGDDDAPGELADEAAALLDTSPDKSGKPLPPEAMIPTPAPAIIAGPQPPPADTGGWALGQIHEQGRLFLAIRRSSAGAEVGTGAKAEMLPAYREGVHTYVPTAGRLAVAPGSTAEELDSGMSSGLTSSALQGVNSSEAGTVSPNNLGQPGLSVDTQRPPKTPSEGVPASAVASGPSNLVEIAAAASSLPDARRELFPGGSPESDAEQSGADALPRDSLRMAVAPDTDARSKAGVVASGQSAMASEVFHASSAAGSSAGTIGAPEENQDFRPDPSARDRAIPATSFDSDSGGEIHRPQNLQWNPAQARTSVQGEDAEALKLYANVRDHDVAGGQASGSRPLSDSAPISSTANQLAGGPKSDAAASPGAAVPPVTVTSDHLPEPMSDARNRAARQADGAGGSSAAAIAPSDAEIQTIRQGVDLTVDPTRELDAAIVSAKEQGSRTSMGGGNGSAVSPQDMPPLYTRSVRPQAPDPMPASVSVKAPASGGGALGVEAPLLQSAQLPTGEANGDAGQISVRLAALQGADESASLMPAIEAVDSSGTPAVRQAGLRPSELQPAGHVNSTADRNATPIAAIQRAADSTVSIPVTAAADSSATPAARPAVLRSSELQRAVQANSAADNGATRIAAVQDTADSTLSIPVTAAADSSGTPARPAVPQLPVSQTGDEADPDAGKNAAPTVAVKDAAAWAGGIAAAMSGRTEAADRPKSTIPDAAGSESRGVAALAATSGTSLQPSIARLEPGLAPPGLATGPGLGEELGHRILWLSGNRLRGAEIHLDPPELGSLQVQIHAHRDGTSVHLLTQTANARDAVENALPRLREMLENSGLSLLDLNVAQQHQQGRQQAREGQDSGITGGAANRLKEVEQTLSAEPNRARALRGLVDDYA